MLGWRFRSRRISMKPLRTRRYGTGKGYAVTHAKGIGHVVHRRSSHRGALASADLMSRRQAARSRASAFEPGQRRVWLAPQN